MKATRPQKSPAPSLRPTLCLFWCALLWLSIGAAPNRAAAAAFMLDWDAPPECPGRDAVLAEVAQLLDRVPASSSRARFSARATIVRAERAWRLQLAVSSGGGMAERVLEDESCLRLGQAAALVLALAVREPTRDTGGVAAVSSPSIDRADEATHPPPAREEPDEPVTAAMPDASGNLSAGTTSAAPPRWLVRVATTADLGSFAGLGAGAEAALGVFFGEARLEAVTSGSWSLSDAGGRGLRLIAGGLQACTPVVASSGLGVCAGGQFGGMRLPKAAEGVASEAPWGALLVGAEAGWTPWSWWGLRAQLQTGLTLFAPTFAVDATGDRRGPAQVFGRLLLGTEIPVR